MLHYFFTTAGRAKTAKQDSNYTHSSEDTNERSMSKNSDKRPTKTHPIILCLSAQHNIQKCVRILADVNALSIDHIM